MCPVGGRREGGGPVDLSIAAAALPARVVKPRVRRSSQLGICYYTRWVRIGGCGLTCPEIRGRNKWPSRENFAAVGIGSRGILYWWKTHQRLHVFPLLSRSIIVRHAPGPVSTQGKQNAANCVGISLGNEARSSEIREVVVVLALELRTRDICSG